MAENDGFGLDKEARNAEAQRERETEIEPLDPPFPYEVIAPDFDFFEVSASWPDPLS